MELIEPTLSTKNTFIVPHTFPAMYAEFVTGRTQITPVVSSFRSLWRKLPDRKITMTACMMA